MHIYIYIYIYIYMSISLYIQNTKASNKQSEQGKNRKKPCKDRTLQASKS